MKCAHLKYYVNTMSTSREILFFTPLAYKPNLENLTFKYLYTSIGFLLYSQACISQIDASPANKCVFFKVLLKK